MIIGFVTIFLCNDQEFDAAKRRYEACVDKVRQKATVLYASEQAVSQTREPEPLEFRLLITEIKPWEDFTEEELEHYGVYNFFTVLAFPPTTAREELFELQPLFDMDWDEDWPVRFPCSYNWFKLSPSGKEEEHLEIDILMSRPRYVPDTAETTTNETDSS